MKRKINTLTDQKVDNFFLFALVFAVWGTVLSLFTVWAITKVENDPEQVKTELLQLTVPSRVQEKLTALID